MLGGSVYIAFIRFMVNIMGVILLFSMICGSRFSRKRTVLYYLCFATAMTAIACIWYLTDRVLYVRIGALTMYLGFAIFAFLISKGSVWMKIYKLVLVFYSMSLYIIASIEVSVFFFGRSVWADIILRIFLILLIAFLFDRYVRESMEGFGNYVEKEADRFSVAAMIICILLGICYIMNPNMNRDMDLSRILQIIVNFLLTGTLQILIFRFYLHMGREKEYERENQLIQMNSRLLERQMEILEESVESSRRIWHDVRHHNAVIAEYARRGQEEELLQYLREYEREIAQGVPEMICSNTAVNNILAAYTSKARGQGINVMLDVSIGKNLMVQSIDLVTILANAYENAIYACMEVKNHPDGRECFIHLMIKKKKNKLVILCRNTCRKEAKLEDGQPKSEFTGGIGVSSILRAVEKYNGECDFKNDDGIFVFRLIMNTEPAEGGK